MDKLKVEKIKKFIKRVKDLDLDYRIACEGHETDDTLTAKDLSEIDYLNVFISENVVISVNFKSDIDICFCYDFPILFGRPFVSLDFKDLEEAYKAAKRIGVIAKDIF
ncbi:hypothetical protein KSU03_12315 [Fusobacterium polymorphum]|uniref:Uncharacterized protein n=1 Tax=Fusobacterium nucleatum subsp. polymorphum TaxID=76857 RepID=A0A2C6BFD8_FUSNP|nr:hypothetical protein [Fusobacterium polymorphum]PHI04338.1 hypothetical protein CBG52_11290 [Fusobacterium polymorphum]